MDSLRYWVTDMHVDGFRFDLASTLAREFYDVDKLSTFFELVQQDPVVSQVKLIAEPWDVGPGGYQVGNFPPQWTEWNGKYRDTVRDFWRGEPATLGEFASRVTGSADLYERDGRRPVASINFVTAHDGFTLADLVSYDEKHNEANGEDNRDGESHNRSSNHGVEGPTDDPRYARLRARQQRNFLATLLLSQGVPMLLHGDECGRTQHGNNNSYAQDSPTLLDALGQRRPAADRIRRGGHPAADGTPDLPPRGILRWPAGAPRARASRCRTSSGSRHPARRCPRKTGTRIRERHRCVPQRRRDTRARHEGQPISDVNFLLLFNAHDAAVEFTIPAAEYSPSWDIVVDTAGASADTGPAPPGHAFDDGEVPRRAPRHQPDAAEVDHSVAASLTVLTGDPGAEHPPSPHGAVPPEG